MTGLIFCAVYFAMRKFCDLDRLEGVKYRAEFFIKIIPLPLLLIFRPDYLVIYLSRDFGKRRVLRGRRISSLVVDAFNVLSSDMRKDSTML